MRNTCKQTKKYFSPEQVCFTDLGYKLTNADSFWAFAELSHPFDGVVTGLPFSIRLGFVFNQDGTQVPVALYDVYQGDSKSNGTKLVRFNSLQDVLDFYQADVKHSFPVDEYDELLAEAVAIYEGCLLDFAVVKGDFTDDVKAKKPFFDSYFTESTDHPDHHIAHISFECGLICKFEAIGLVPKGQTTLTSFKANAVNTINRMENAPIVGEYVSEELNQILNKMFWSNKYLGIRTEA